LFHHDVQQQFCGGTSNAEITDVPVNTDVFLDGFSSGFLKRFFIRLPETKISVQKMNEYYCFQLTFGLKS
jgi:hypothetical protein